MVEAPVAGAKPVAHLIMLSRIVALGLAGSLYCVANAGTVLDLQLSTGHDSALNQSSWEPKAGQVQGAELTLSRSAVIDGNSGWVLRGRLAYERNASFSALNNLALGLDAIYRVQPEAGFTQPWFELEAGALQRQYSGSAMRDGAEVHAGALVGQRWTDRLRARAGAGWSRRWGQDGEVFDLLNRRAFVDFGLRVGDDSLLFARINRSWGDQVFGGDPPVAAGAPLPSWWSDSYAKAGARAHDPVFVDDWWAYRTQAIASTLTLGFNLPLNGNSAVSFGVDRSLISAQGGSRYDRTQVSAALQYRF
jgi:hypothetical protein